MTDLRKLIEAVEGGCATRDHFFCIYGEDDFNNAESAYHDSLDAAKALHESLLPGWASRVWSAQGEDADAEVYPPLVTGHDFNGRTEGGDIFSAEVDGNNPARAWLIAVLKAYEAQR